MTKRPLERDVQKAIVDALRLAGLTVHETTAWKQKGSSGVDKGIPDLLVFVPKLYLIYIGLEVKRDEKAPRSKEQLEAVASGEYPFVWEPETALAHVRDVIFDLDHSHPAVDRIKAVLKSLRGAA